MIGKRHCCQEPIVFAPQSAVPLLTQLHLLYLSITAGFLDTLGQLQTAKCVFRILVGSFNQFSRRQRKQRIVPDSSLDGAHRPSHFYPHETLLLPL